MRINQIIFILFLSFLASFLTSCINEVDNNNPNNNNPEQRLYLYDTNTHQHKYIAESSNCLLVPALNKVLFQWAGLWSYDILTGKIELVADHNIGPIDDYSISPDSKHLVYGSGDKLFRINLESFEEEELEKLNGEFESSSRLRFSNDGKRVIFLTHPSWREDLTNFDSLYVNIYDFEQAKLLKLDAVFIKDSYPYFVYFTDNSNNFFVGTSGRDSFTQFWKLSISVYNNSIEPTFSHKLVFYPDSHIGQVWNGSNETIYIKESSTELVQYDINSKTVISSTDISGYGYLFRKVKDSNELVGRNYTNNKIMVLNIITNESVIYETGIEENISDYHYVTGYNYIAIHTSEYK